MVGRLETLLRPLCIERLTGDSRNRGACRMSYFSDPGKDFTDRQRIKRKSARWASKFVMLERHERDAILRALDEASKDAHSFEAGFDRCLCGHTDLAHEPSKPRSCGRHCCSCLHFRSDETQKNPNLFTEISDDLPQIEPDKMDNIDRCDSGRMKDAHDVSCFWRECDSFGVGVACECESCFPMPDFGITKLSPRESAEMSAENVDGLPQNQQGACNTLLTTSDLRKEAICS